MIYLLEESIPILFYSFLFTVPFIFYTGSSELFEFNKMITTYLFTVLICGSWIFKMIITKKIIFRRTILDIPLLVFLAIQLLSTVFSIDIRTSVFGYYSRFHGGLLSYVSYSLLYWAYVSNMNWDKSKKVLNLLLISALLVSVYAIFEHFGHSFSCLIIRKEFNVNCWVQDVKTRVFATLGQPNWLAAWMVALIPIAWASALINKSRKTFFLLISAIFYLTLLFTKSRSGILGFVASYLIFWGGFFWFQRTSSINFKKSFLFITLAIALVTIIVGTPWTPKASELKPVGPALETGSTESGEIRKIVWKGALTIWKNYPILGTGPETFAFSYWQFRPVEHNLVSEWDFLYNKAHNEYLNFLANTGLAGFLSYLLLIGTTLFLFAKFTIYNSQLRADKNPEDYKLYVLNFALLAGYASILVTNFFGFSVVMVSLIFFLYPAISLSLDNQQPISALQLKILSTSQKSLLVGAGVFILYCLFSLGKYWYADSLYAKGKSFNEDQNFLEAKRVLTKTVSLSPNEAIYWDELSESDSAMAVTLAESGNQKDAKELAKMAEEEIKEAERLSPRNLKIKRNMYSFYLRLSTVDTAFLSSAKDILLKTQKFAPTDAKILYQLGLTYIKLGEKASAISVLEKAVEVKPNYSDARYALAVTYLEKKENEKAKSQLEYILEKIDSKNESAEELLNRIEK